VFEAIFMVSLDCAEAAPATMNVNNAHRTTVSSFFISVPPWIDLGYEDQLPFPSQIATPI
jgi:hypothetical protein